MRGINKIRMTRQRMLLWIEKVLNKYCFEENGLINHNRACFAQLIALSDMANVNVNSSSGYRSMLIDKTNLTINIDKENEKDNIDFNIISENDLNIEYPGLGNNSYINNINKKLTNVDIMGGINDMFMGGTGAPINTTEYAIMALAKHPQAQQEVFDELKQVIGLNECFSLNKQTETPKFIAFIYETMRFYAPVRLVPPHVLSQDLTFESSQAPQKEMTLFKDTLIFMNATMLNRDKNVFKYPNEFNIYNFLSYDESNNCYNVDSDKKNSITTFGFGTRMCFGKYLAIKEFIIVWGTLIRKYKFEAIDGKPENISMEKEATSLDGQMKQEPVVSITKRTLQIV